jgi:hypothetical protein
MKKNLSWLIGITLVLGLIVSGCDGSLSESDLDKAEGIFRDDYAGGSVGGGSDPIEMEPFYAIIDKYKVTR